MIKESICNDILLYTKKQAAIALSVSERTIDRLVKKGELPVVQIGRNIRIPRQAVFDWIEGRTSYNLGCAGSAVQGASTCHISARKVRTGGHLSQMQTERELDILLEPPNARKRKL